MAKNYWIWNANADGTGRPVTVESTAIASGNSAIVLDVDETNPGFLRLVGDGVILTQELATYTTALRPAAAAYPPGLPIYNTTTKSLQVSDGSAWLEVAQRGYTVTWTVGTEASDAIEVGGVLKDRAGNTVGPVSLAAYVSGQADGLSIASPNVGGGIAVTKSGTAVVAHYDAGQTNVLIEAAVDAVPSSGIRVKTPGTAGSVPVKTTDDFTAASFSGGADAVAATKDFSAVGAGTFDPTGTAAVAGTGGNSKTLAISGKKTAGATSALDGNAVSAQYQSKVTTVAQLKTALAAQSAVMTFAGGTDAAKLYDAADAFAFTNLAGGADEIAAVKSEVLCATGYDATVQATVGGVAGNAYQIEAVANAPAGGATATQLAGVVTAGFEPRVSTVGNVNTAIDALAGGDDILGVKVGAAGTTARVLFAADDTTGWLAFTGGDNATKATCDLGAVIGTILRAASVGYDGNSLRARVVFTGAPASGTVVTHSGLDYTIECENRTETPLDLEAAVGALAGPDAMIEVGTISGAPTKLLANAVDTFAAVNLAGGVDTIAAVKASLDLGTLAEGEIDSVVEATTAGAAGNSLRVRAVGGGAPASGVAVTRAVNDFTITFEERVGTVAQADAAIESLVGGDDLIGVLTPGTAATILSNTSDDFAATALAGGAEAVRAELACAGLGTGVHNTTYEVIAAGTDGNSYTLALSGDAADDYGIAVGASGLLLGTVKDREQRVITTAGGAFSAIFTDTNGRTFYWVAVAPDGTLMPSPAITLAA